MKKLVTLKLESSKLSTLDKDPVQASASSPMKLGRSKVVSSGTSSMSPSPAGSRSQSPLPKSKRAKTGRNGRSGTPSRSLSGYNSRSGTPFGGRTTGYQGNNMRIGSLTMNANTSVSLDKSGKPCGKWVKDGSISKKIKTFTGYEVHFHNWLRSGGPAPLHKQKETERSGEKAKSPSVKA